MRTPEDAGELATLDHVLVTRLDVLDGVSIAAARDAALERFGSVDVLVNNAGYGAYGPLEAFSMDRIRRQFDTNVIGLLEVTKALFPHFRELRSGVVINISSIGGQMTFPLGTLYHGTKFAVEGLSEALHYELEAFGVRVKLVEPGMVKTDFGGRSFDFCNDQSLAEYQETVGKLFAYGSTPSDPSAIADVIWTAAHDDRQAAVSGRRGRRAPAQQPEGTGRRNVHRRPEASDRARGGTTRRAVSDSNGRFVLALVASQGRFERRVRVRPGLMGNGSCICSQPPQLGLHPAVPAY
jgi:NADP-dependent 3-hydroxy acid dehydrogenase YdfG